MAIIDVATDVGAYAEHFARAGVTTVIRHYNHRNVDLPGERLDAAEKAALEAAGLAIAVVFQQTGAGDHAEGFSYSQGRQDARRALDLAAKLGQPRGSAIYFAVGHDLFHSTDLSRLRAYFQAAGDEINTHFRIGAYGSGHVCRMLLDGGLADLTWMSLSGGWHSGQAFLSSLDWSLMQQGTGIWPDAGFAYAPNIANPSVPDFGQFHADQTGFEHAAAARPDTILRIIARDGLNLRAGPGTGYDVKAVLPCDRLVFGHQRNGDWVLVDIPGDAKRDGHMHADFLEVLAGGFAATYPPGSSAYEIARIELAEDIRDCAGKATNPRIFLYHASTSHGDADAVAWSSSFVNFCVSQAGLIGTNSKWALSWHEQEWGQEVTGSAQEGDIVVFSRTYRNARGNMVTGGHVGFYLSGTEEHVTVLGGNQGNRISIQSLPRDGAYRGQVYKLKSMRRAPTVSG
jgi:uncharacterized protein (TIGR02594 family)